ncbi:MAG: hypothetical protein OXN84_05010 [Albidovulum sp.]|nr:hypothetical protein [Albidovulum sp.]
MKLTRSVQDSRVKESCGGVHAYLWPSCGITFIASVEDMPGNSIGYVPTRAIVAPLEFTMPKCLFF